LESSGWGSKMKRPSFVRFFSSCLLDLELDLVLTEVREPTEVPRGWGPYGDGRDEAEWRAGACCSPRGSLRLCTLLSRMTDPVETWGQLEPARKKSVCHTWDFVGIGAENSEAGLARGCHLFGCGSSGGRTAAKEPDHSCTVEKGVGLSSMWKAGVVVGRHEIGKKWWKREEGRKRCLRAGVRFDRTPRHSVPECMHEIDSHRLKRVISDSDMARAVAVIESSVMHLVVRVLGGPTCTCCDAVGHDITRSWLPILIGQETARDAHLSAA
jgi:hypothetical protein